LTPPKRTIGAAPSGFLYPSVSPDGKRIVFISSQIEWDIVEVSIPDAALRTLISGGVTVSPDWSPSGTHFVYAKRNGSDAGIEDRQAGIEGFSRRLIDVTGVVEAAWSPDGSRLAFYSESKAISQLNIANASGSGAVLLDSTRLGTLRGLSWSPDGQWISYLRSVPGKEDLMKVRATPGATPEVVPNAEPRPWEFSMTRWAADGKWIAYPVANGIDLITPDGTSTRKLSLRRFLAYNFSKDGSELYGIFQNATGRETNGNTAQWQLFSVGVKTGAETFLTPIEFPTSVAAIYGFSIHPDGRRFLTSIDKFPLDIWMVEGFNESQSRKMIDRIKSLFGLAGAT
jgi:WD40 repeat protein